MVSLPKLDSVLYFHMTSSHKCPHKKWYCFCKNSSDIIHIKLLCNFQLCEVFVFLSSTDTEDFNFLGNDTASLCNQIPKFRSNSSKREIGLGLLTVEDKDSKLPQNIGYDYPLTRQRIASRKETSF